MNILAIETSSSACSVALLVKEEVTALHRLLPMQQAQCILPLIKQCLESKNHSLKQLDALAFGCGPGSFTGIRIAASVIQGLGFALDLPILSISSLLALAQASYDAFKWEKIVVAVDARIQEVYSGLYEANNHGRMVLMGEEILCKPEAVLVPDGNHWYAVGSAWEVYKQRMPGFPAACDVTQLPTAEAIARLAKIKYENKEWVAPEDALPLYLRDSVAKKQGEK